MSTRIEQRRRARKKLEAICEHPENVIVIHYSCESFYDRPNGASPRITSIAVRNLGSAQTTSFSIHQVAEREKKIGPEDIEADYDRFEKKMLSEFYEYAEKNKKCLWLHWNMRDINYGFPALAHRFKVLGGKPIELPESQLYDLARILVGLYGVGYAKHPRLPNVMGKNDITALSFLNGKQEVEAFENREYVKLHQSTLRKVDIFANILGRASDGSLKTDARLKGIYGGYFAAFMSMIREHWIFSLVSFVGAIASIFALIFT